MKRKTKRAKAHGAPAPSDRGDLAAPAQGRAAHNPLPWAIVFTVAESDRVRVIDAHGVIVLEADGNSEVDIANLELIVGSVNGPRPGGCNGKTLTVEPEVRAAGFHESRCRSFTGGACDCVALQPVSESSEPGQIGGA